MKPAVLVLFSVSLFASTATQSVCENRLALEELLQETRYASSPHRAKKKEMALSILLMDIYRINLQKRGFAHPLAERIAPVATMQVINRLRRARKLNEEPRTYTEYVFFVAKMSSLEELRVRYRKSNQTAPLVVDIPYVEESFPEIESSIDRLCYPLSISEKQLVGLQNSVDDSPKRRKMTKLEANNMRKQVAAKIRKRFPNHTVLTPLYYADRVESNIWVDFIINGKSYQILAMGPTKLTLRERKKLGTWASGRPHKTADTFAKFPLKLFNLAHHYRAAESEIEVNITRSQASVALLKAVQIRTPSDIAEALGIDENTASRRLVKLTREMKMQLSPEDAKAFNMIDVTFYPIDFERNHLMAIWSKKGSPVYFGLHVGQTKIRSSRDPIKVSLAEIAAAINKISVPAQKSVLEMKFLQHLTKTEIAQELGTNEKMVAEYLQLGLKRVGILLGKPELNVHNIRIIEHGDQVFHEHTPDTRWHELREPIEVSSRVFLQKMKELEVHHARWAEATKLAILGDGMTTKQIARKMRIEEHSVETYVSRGLNYLRKELSLPKLRPYNISLYDELE